MKVIAKYPFQGVPGMQQLSFPAGATIRAKHASNQGGWMYGSYGNQNGWFPESYVERYGGLPAAPQPPLTPVYEKQIQTPTTTATTTTASPQSPHLSYDNTKAEENDLPPLQSIAFDRDDANREPAYSHDSSDPGAFAMMGGTPGDLFEGAPTPSFEEQPRSASPTFLKQEEEPVDIYRHAPPRQNRNHQSEYTSEISVQITSAAAPVTPPSRTKVAPAEASPVAASDFWKAHPGRADKAPTARQAAELERAFQGLEDTETIVIVPHQEKKKKFPYIPKSIKKAAKKTQKTLQGAVHRSAQAQRA